MQAEINATGLVGEVNNQVATQIKTAQRDDPTIWPVLSTLRDLINAEVRKTTGNSQGQVTVRAKLEVVVEPAEEPAIAPPPAATVAAGAGVPAPSLADQVAAASGATQGPTAGRRRASDQL